MDGLCSKKYQFLGRSRFDRAAGRFACEHFSVGAGVAGISIYVWGKNVNIFKIIAVFCFYASLGHSSVSVSKQYSFSPEQIADLELKIQTLGKRSPEAMEYPTFVTVDSQQSITLYCPKNLPDSQGIGCNLIFLIKLPDQVFIKIQKPLALTATYSEVAQTLSKANPNDHIHFGNILNKNDASSTHYFCSFTNAWGCFLYISEEF